VPEVPTADLNDLLLVRGLLRIKPRTPLELLLVVRVVMAVLVGPTVPTGVIRFTHRVVMDVGVVLGGADEVIGKAVIIVLAIRIAISDIQYLVQRLLVLLVRLPIADLV